MFARLKKAVTREKALESVPLLEKKQDKDQSKNKPKAYDANVVQSSGPHVSSVPCGPGTGVSLLKSLYLYRDAMGWTHPAPRTKPDSAMEAERLQNIVSAGQTASLREPELPGFDGASNLNKNLAPARKQHSKTPASAPIRTKEANFEMPPDNHHSYEYALWQRKKMDIAFAQKVEEMKKDGRDPKDLLYTLPGSRYGG